MQSKNYRPVSVIGWLGTLLLSMIPGVNLIMWFVWAFSAKRPSRRSYAVALLILTAIFLALALVGVSLYGKQMLEWARSLDPELFTPKAAG